jgi:hypothetical protein
MIQKLKAAETFPFQLKLPDCDDCGREIPARDIRSPDLQRGCKLISCQMSGTRDQSIEVPFAAVFDIYPARPASRGRRKYFGRRAERL